VAGVAAALVSVSLVAQEAELVDQALLLLLMLPHHKELLAALLQLIHQVALLILCIPLILVEH
jgi:hypothetical protein